MLASSSTPHFILHSTTACLIKNTDKWYKGLDNGCISGIVLINLMKAFNYGLQMNEFCGLALIFLIVSSFVKLEPLTLILETLVYVFHKGLA